MVPASGSTELPKCVSTESAIAITTEQPITPQTMHMMACSVYIQWKCPTQTISSPGLSDCCTYIMAIRSVPQRNAQRAGGLDHRAFRIDDLIGVDGVTDCDIDDLAVL